MGGGKKTYNTRDSLVVTDPITSLAVTGLSRGERTGSRIFQHLWSYVMDLGFGLGYLQVSGGAGKTRERERGISARPSEAAVRNGLVRVW